MEMRSKRQEREAEEEERKNPNYRRWADLPELALSSVSDHLHSIPDLFSFSAVCRSFSLISHTSSTVSAVPRPPLLLRSFVPSNRRFSPWPRHPRCRLQSIVPTDTARSFHSNLHPKTLTSTCLGHSYGHLIVDVGATCVIANIITGAETNACLDRYAYRAAAASVIATLTAPPTSSGAVCWLVMSNPRCTMFWKVGTYEHVIIGDLRYDREVVSLAVMGDKVLSLGKNFQLFVVDLTPKITWRQWDVPPPELPHSPTSNYDGVFSPRLIECGGDLLVLIVERKVYHPTICRFRVYRLDVDEMRWAAMERGVGDNWCVFLDAVGQRAVACRDPASWGGRSNSVYVAGPLIDTWSVFPLDGSEVDVMNSPLEDGFASLERWPSPVWFYPSMFFK